MNQFLHHRYSIRLQDYNYTSNGWYYVTICTKNRRLFFKNICIKQIVRKYWLNIPDRFNNVKLDEFMIMPNHIHGIVVIESSMELASHIAVGAIHELPLHERMKRRRRMLLPKIIGWFKMNSAKQINILLRRSGQPLWQRNYFESIIRDDKSLNKIRRYIKNNPLNWENDRNNPRRWAGGK